MSFPTLFSLSFLFLLMISSKCHAQLSKDYYKNSCPDVESIVRTAVDRKMQQTFVTAPATLRLFFHDCFVRVCCLLLSQENEIPALSLTLMSYVLNLFFFFFWGAGQGCDASVILFSWNNTAEKDNSDNLSLAGDGFDTVIKAKEAVESVPGCRQKVSCADILALATREVVRLVIATQLCPIFVTKQFCFTDILAWT